MTGYIRMAENRQLFNILSRLVLERDRNRILTLPQAGEAPVSEREAVRIPALLASLGVPSKWAPEAQRVIAEAFQSAGQLSVGHLRELLAKLSLTDAVANAGAVEAYFRKATSNLAEALPSFAVVDRFDDDTPSVTRAQFLELFPVLEHWPRTIVSDPSWNTIESPLPGLPDLPLTDTWVHLRMRRLRAGSYDLEVETSRLIQRVLNSRTLGEPLIDVLHETRGLTAIVGQPGSGKSTLVRWLAQHFITDPECPFLVPVHIPLRAFALDLEKRPGLTLFEYFLEQREVESAAQIVRWLRLRDGLGASGGAGRGFFFWLIDGWDEVPPRLVAAVLDELRRIQHEPGFVTTRHSALPYRLPCDRFFEVLPLSRPSQKILMESWLRGMGREASVDTVSAWLDRSQSLRELAAIPFLLVVICGIASGASNCKLGTDARESCPEIRNRYELYDRAISSIREAHNKVSANTAFDDGSLRATQALACWLTFDAREAPRWVFDSLDVMDFLGNDDLLHRVLAPSRLICAPAPNSTSYQFLHATLQEFLAARRLLEAGFNSRLGDGAELLLHGGFSEVLRFVAGAPDRGEACELWPLLRKALERPDDHGLVYARAAHLVAERGDGDGGLARLGTDLREALWGVLWTYRGMRPEVLLGALIALDSVDTCRRILRAAATDKVSLGLVVSALEITPASLWMGLRDDPEFEEWMQGETPAELFSILDGEVRSSSSGSASEDLRLRLHGSIGRGDAVNFFIDYDRVLEGNLNDLDLAEETVQLASELGASAVAHLLRAIENADLHPTLRGEAARSLVSCGSTGVQALKDLLIASGDEELLGFVLPALVGVSLSPPELDVVRDLMLNSGDPFNRETAIAVIENSRIPEATKWMIEAYGREKNSEVRRAILDGLGYRGDQDAVPWLWARLDGAFRGKARERQAEREATYKALLEVTARNRHRWDSKVELRRIGERLVQLMSTILEKVSDPLFEATVYGAERFPEISTRLVIEVAQSESVPHTVRVAACRTLGARRERDAIDVLSRLVTSLEPNGSDSDDDESVGFAAAEALSEISPTDLARLEGLEARRVRAALAFDRGILFFTDLELNSLSPLSKVVGEKPAVLPQCEKRIWDLLDGKAMTALELALVVANRKSASEAIRGTVRRLRKKGYVIKNQRGLGFYRPDAPPTDQPG